MDFYKNTEKLLYKYPILKKHLAIAKLDIEDIEKEGEKRRSPSVVLLTNSNKNYSSTVEAEAIPKSEKYLTAIKKTEKLVNKIDAALSYVCNKEAMSFIKMKYFENKCIDDICDALCISRSTAFRLKNNIISNLSIVLFGADVIDLY